MKITFKMIACMRSHANSTGHSMGVAIFESASYKNNTYTQNTLEIIVISIQFSALIAMELLLSKELNFPLLLCVKH